MSYRPKERSTRRAMNLDSLSDATGEFEKLSSADDSGQHVSYGHVLRTQARFMNEVLGMFRAYDEELREMSNNLATMRAQVTILMWLAGTSMVGVVSLLMKLAFGARAA